jgi:outer membrane lipoprotein-sorting protein
MVLDATRSRQETEMQDKSKMVMIFDWGRGKSLTLEPTTKKAMVLTLANLSKDQVSRQDTFAQFRSILLDARDKPDVKREPLGEKDIDGRRVVGFRVSSRGTAVSLWGDPKTGLPVRAEATMAMFPNVKITMSDFVFNLDMDESLFSVEPPAGYTVQNMKLDASPPEEKDLIETFRAYSKLGGGAFPDSLDLQTMIQMVAKELGKKLAIEMLGDKPRPGKEKPNKEQMHKIMEAIQEAGMQKVADVQIPLQRGLLFALTLPTDADAHYAGKGVSYGAADRPIFWYRPKDAKKYRVIYADLSVRDADTPPNAPDAQRVPGLSTPKK